MTKKEREREREREREEGNVLFNDERDTHKHTD